jgi:hypothetical protein
MVQCQFHMENNDGGGNDGGGNEQRRDFVQMLEQIL